MVLGAGGQEDGLRPWRKRALQIITTGRAFCFNKCPLVKPRFLHVGGRYLKWDPWPIGNRISFTYKMPVNDVYNPPEEITRYTGMALLSALCSRLLVSSRNVWAFVQLLLQAEFFREIMNEGAKILSFKQNVWYRYLAERQRRRSCSVKTG